jgi:hypothetical protein
MKARTRNLAIAMLLTAVEVTAAARSCAAPFTAPAGMVSTWPLLVVMFLISATSLANLWVQAVPEVFGGRDAAGTEPETRPMLIRTALRSEVDV